ncbi:MAG: hypothetical protein GY804_07210 [Alphaproteobacteria bacterium]|nr:hypothetical protein [Alphaproteobacteria bacterium]
MEKDAFYEEALEYHRNPNGAGKISIVPTKALDNQKDLALAYSPGVAAPCKEIEANPDAAYDYTARGNLVAVITNGTAVLGLGSIGALASKPVMEGKSVLFKKFSGVDSIDLEVDELDVDKFIEIVAALEPSFGGINLEDIKAPECFEIEERLKERMNIPVFHDDQHGTAIIVGAAVTNWLKLSGRDIKQVKLAVSGAGASAMSCVKILVSLGMPQENIIMSDKEGCIYKGRAGLTKEKLPIAVETDCRTLADAMKGADIFLGLSAAGVAKKEMVAGMADAPLIMALANPTPEIMPEEARAAKPDAVICTGRSDYPNQVNNVLCFPFIFRGALDCGATAINEEMKLACVKALAEMTMSEADPRMKEVYGADAVLTFGPEYIIPKPFDGRCIENLPVEVAKAAAETGVATRPIKDFDAYKAKLATLTK